MPCPNEYADTVTIKWIVGSILKGTACRAPTGRVGSLYQP